MRGGRVDATDVHQKVAVLEVWQSPLIRDASLQEKETGRKGGRQRMTRTGRETQH